MRENKRGRECAAFRIRLKIEVVAAAPPRVKKKITPVRFISNNGNDPEIIESYKLGPKFLIILNRPTKIKTY